MNNCTRKTGLEAFGIGLLTLIIGNIGFYLSMNKNDYEKKKKEYPQLNIILFLTGFILHFAIEIIGLNQWYCDKKCMIGIRSLAKIN